MRAGPRRSCSRWAGLAAVAAVATAWRLVVFPRVDPLSVADVVVALDGDRPRRLRAAVDLVVAGYGAVLVVVRAENAAPELLRRPSMPFEVLSFVPSPPTTRGEARGVAALAAARGWRRILVVTSTFHITRARLIFERALDCEVVFASAGMNRRRVPRYVLSETAKLLLALTLRRAA
jgi:DUF218 domain-containing protein